VTLDDLPAVSASWEDIACGSLRRAGEHIRLETYLAMLAINKSQLVSEYVRTLVARFQSHRPSAQLSLPILYQMRNATPLSLDNAPECVPVFVPGCSQTDASRQFSSRLCSCSWVGERRSPPQ
jgi:hypothetical protein